MAKITLKGTTHQTVGDLNDVRLDGFKGKRKILTINPSFDTAVCATEGLDRVIPLSMMRSKNFAKDYGVLIQDGPLAGVTARAIVVVDENDEVVHTELVQEITEEPDYTAALNSIC